MKTKSMVCVYTLALTLALASATFAQTPAPKFDSETISGLGARNIGSATMSGRIAAIDAVQEGQRLTVYIGSASGGVWKSLNGGFTFQAGFCKQPGPPIRARLIRPQK